MIEIDSDTPIDSRIIEDRVHELMDVLFRAVKQDNWSPEFKKKVLKGFNLSMEIKEVLEV